MADGGARRAASIAIGGLFLTTFVMVSCSTATGDSVAIASNPENLFLFTEAEATSDADYRYVISMGTGNAIDRGESRQTLPEELRVRVGEVIEIVNDDDRGHIVGPFFIGEGETVRQRFTSPGFFSGGCTVHLSRRLEIVISEA